MAASKTADLDALKLELVRLEDIQVKATEKGHYNSAIKAVAAAQEVRARIARLDAERRLANARSELERIKILRGLAVADGSWIAAEKLQQREEELREEERAEKERKRLDSDNLSDDEILSELSETLRALPLSLRQKIIRRVQETRTTPAESEDE